MKRFFNYIKPIWTGHDGKPSLRSILAILFSLHMIAIVTIATITWEGDRSLAQLDGILAFEGGLVAALLSITVVQNIQHKKEDTKKEIEEIKAEATPMIPE